MGLSLPAGIEAGIDPGPLVLWASMFAAGDPAGRISTVEAALKSRRGPY